MNLIVDGLHISGYDSGQNQESGKTALLLHGWGNNHDGMKHVADELKGYRIIAPDLPGFGGSQPPKEVWGVREYADFITALLKKLEVERIDLLLGHSFGGRISLELAGLHMIPVGKMVLLASHGLPEPKSAEGILIWLLARLGKATPRFIREPVGRLFTSSDFRAANGIMQDVLKRVVSQDATSEAKAIRCPVLLVYGSEDKITPPEMGSRFSQLIRDSKLELVEGADHHLHQHNPKEVTELIKEFI